MPLAVGTELRTRSFLGGAPLSSRKDEVVGLAVFKAPDDPEERKAFGHSMLRIQVAMWLPASCLHCGREYASVDDWLARKPRGGDDKKQPCGGFVDDACWAAYATGRGLVE